MSVWLSIGAVAVIVCLITTLNLALRLVSFSRLAKRLADRGREHWIDIYRQSEERFILATATLRTWFSLALVLVVSYMVHDFLSPDGGVWTRYITIFLISMSLIAVIGVAIPQALAKYLAVGVLSAGWSLPAIQLIDVLTWPVTRILRGLDVIVRRLAAIPEIDEQSETEQIEQEVLDAVEEAEMQGAVDETEKAMIKSVMELDESTAEEIMTPRTDIIGIEKDSPLSAVKALIKKEGHSRIPVYDGTIDRVLGLVYAKDLLHVSDDTSFKLVDHVRPVSFVPQTKSVRDLLTEFQSGKTHAALIGDEYGGTAGLVTIEDILEELVGEIADEFEPPEPQPIVRLNDHTIEVDSKVHVDEINDLLNLDIPEEEDYETIGGFVFSTLGKIPAAGEELMHDDVKITVLDAGERRIHRLKIETSGAKAAG